MVMSGDAGLENEPIIFYSTEMTISKMIVLKHKGIKFNLYNKVIKKIDKPVKKRKQAIAIGLAMDYKAHGKKNPKKA